MNETLIDGIATFKHLNIRKEGPSDEKILAIDVKLAGCDCQLDLLRLLLGARDVSEVSGSFWDGQGEVRFTGLEQPITSWAEIEDCEVKIGGLRLHALIRKFKVTLGAKRSATVDFAVSVKDPSANATPILAEMVSDEVRVSVEKRQGELFSGPQEMGYL